MGQWLSNQNSIEFSQFLQFYVGLNRRCRVNGFFTVNIVFETNHCDGNWPWQVQILELNTIIFIWCNCKWRLKILLHFWSVSSGNSPTGIMFNDFTSIEQYCKLSFSFWCTNANIFPCIVWLTKSCAPLNKLSLLIIHFVR